MPRKAKIVKTEVITIVEPVLPVTETVETPKVTKAPRKPNKWLIHVATVKESNPTISYRDVLKLAKESYTK